MDSYQNRVMRITPQDYVWFLEGNKYILFNQTDFYEYENAVRKKLYTEIVQFSLFMEHDLKSLLTHENLEVRKRAKAILNGK